MKEAIWRVLAALFVLSLVSLMPLFGQLACEAPPTRVSISVAETGTGVQTLWLGYDTAASYGVDSEFCEKELPPVPPTGFFDTRFVNIPGRTNRDAPGGLGEGTRQDYRQAAYRIQIDTFTLQFQPGDSGSYPITLRWSPYDFQALYDSARLTDALGGFVIDQSMNNVDSLIVTQQAISTLRIYCFGPVYDLPVPIQLASLSGFAAGENAVTLEWSTASEVNNYGFFVERRSADANGVYRELPNSFVPGSGTTLEQQYYRWTDSTAAPGAYYYRLRQVDLNGDFTYTFEILVVVETTLGADGDGGESPYTNILFPSYPNPFNPSTRIEFRVAAPSFVVLRVVTLLGEEVALLLHEEKAPGSYSMEWDASRSPAGLYFSELNVYPRIAHAGAQEPSASYHAVRKLLFLK